MAPTRQRRNAHPNARNNNQRLRPTLPLLPDFNVSDLTNRGYKLRVTDGDISEESTFTVPQLPTGASPSLVLYFLSQFEICAENMRWTTGPVLFTKFRSHLLDSYRTLWDRQVIGIGTTVSNFQTQVEEFKASLLVGYNYHAQLRLLSQMKKPPDMTPLEFYHKAIAAEDRIKQLPGAPPVDAGFTEEARKYFFHDAMPKSWRDAFQAANCRVEDEELTDLVRYFDACAQRDPYVPRNQQGPGQNNRSNNNRRFNNHRNNNNNDTNNNNSRRRTNGPRNNTNNNNGNRQTQRNQNNRSTPRNEDPCPLHDGHLWGECHNNAYRWQQQRNGNRSNNRGSNQRQESNNVEANSLSNQSNSSTNNDRSSASNNGNNDNDDNYYFCLECDTDALASEPESFLFENSVQEEFETDVDFLPPTPPVTDPPKPNRDELIPSTLAIAKQINDHKGHFLMRSLLDPGGSHVIVNRRCLPSNCDLIPINSNEQSFNTAAGSFASTHYVFLRDLILPEFNFSRRIQRVKAYVFNNASIPYDVIFGRSFLNNCRIDICSSDLTCRWYNDSIPFHPPNFFSDNDAIRTILQVPSARVSRLEHAIYTTTAAVTPTKTTFASVEEVCQQQTHLTPEQREQLLAVMQKHASLFDGTHPHFKQGAKKFHLELDDNAVPYHCNRPYDVPQYNLPVLKEEIDRQVKLGILERVYETEWGMPMLILKKKDGAIRTCDDFRMLNKFVKRKKYPLPRIQDIFRRRRGYKYMSKIDLTLCYYSYELDEESSLLCVLVTPFGKYRRKRLPMGLKQSSDWAQASIEETLDDLLIHCIEAYIDDVGAFSNSWDEHLEHLDQTFLRLNTNGYKVNPAKCEWAVQETDWLGHWLTPDGIKPWKKKIQGILALDRPKTVHQLRSFLGMVKWYRDFWKRRAHILAPLNASTTGPRKKLINWTTPMNDAFQQIKSLIAEEVLLYYPDPNKQFIIETDASDYQLGAVIYQMHGNEKRPVAFFSRALTAAQRRYPASDKEALCITEVFDEFRPILYGADILIKTDHQNLTAVHFKSHRLLHWRLLLEEFSPTFQHQPGKDNVCADPLSRLPLTPISPDSRDDPSSFLAECLLYYPNDIDSFPLTFAAISEAQQNDPALLPLADRDDYQLQVFHGQELIARQIANQWKIVLPQPLADSAIHWYHAVLGHCGLNRLVSTLRSHFWIPNLKQRVSEFISKCDDCQRHKFHGPGQGHLPPANDVNQPWEEIAVDLIGPWKITLPLGTLNLHAITIIDTTTTLSETHRIDNKTAAHCALQLENQWLARYPRPLRCIHDQGPEFIALIFQDTLIRNGIRPCPTSVKNPQSNSICERMHKTIQNMLNPILRSNPPDNVETAVDLLDSCIASATRALRSAVHATLGISPGALVFHRDMFLPIPIMADYNLIRERRQAVIDENNRRQNLRRRFRDYSPGDQVLLLLPSTSTLGDKTAGPFEVLRPHVNGTVTIQRAPGVLERINIRRLKPYSP